MSLPRAAFFVFESYKETIALSARCVVAVMPTRYSLGSLTAPCAYIFLVKFRVMNEDQKKEMQQCIENAEEVQDFLQEWYNVPELFETAAKAGSIVLGEFSHLCEESRKVLNALIEQHVMMTNLLKKFEKGGTL